MAYYNRSKFHFLAVSFDPALGRTLSILSCPGDWPDTRLTFPMPPIPLPDGVGVHPHPVGPPPPP